MGADPETLAIRAEYAPKQGMSVFNGYGIAGAKPYQSPAAAVRGSGFPNAIANQRIQARCNLQKNRSGTLMTSPGSTAAVSVAAVSVRSGSAARMMITCFSFAR